MATPDRIISARLHPSGFEKSDSNFFSLTRGSDGHLYYTLSSHDIDTHARIFRYDPEADTVEQLGVIGEIVGEAGTGTGAGEGADAGVSPLVSLSTTVSTMERICVSLSAMPLSPH